MLSVWVSFTQDELCWLREQAKFYDVPLCNMIRNRALNIDSRIYSSESFDQLTWVSSIDDPMCRLYLKERVSIKE